MTQTQMDLVFFGIVIGAVLFSDAIVELLAWLLEAL